MKWWIGVVICIAPLAILSNFIEELDMVGAILCTVIAVYALFKGKFLAVGKDFVGIFSKWIGSIKSSSNETAKTTTEAIAEKINSDDDSLLKVNVVWHPKAIASNLKIKTASNGVPGTLFFKKDKIVFQHSEDWKNCIDFGYPFFESAVLSNGIRLWNKWTYFFTFESVEELNQAKQRILMQREEAPKGFVPLDENGRRIVEGNWGSGKNHSEGRSQWSTVEQGARFERECQRYFDYRGYSTQITGKTGDFGVDIVATRNGERVAIQCKNWKSKVGPKAIQEVVAGRVHHRCDRAVVVSQNGFTKAAQELAKSNNVILLSLDE